MSQTRKAQLRSRRFRIDTCEARKLQTSIAVNCNEPQTFECDEEQDLFGIDDEDDDGFTLLDCLSI